MTMLGVLLKAVRAKNASQGHPKHSWTWHISKSPVTGASYPCSSNCMHGLFWLEPFIWSADYSFMAVAVRLVSSCATWKDPVGWRANTLLFLLCLKILNPRLASLFRSSRCSVGTMQLPQANGQTSLSYLATNLHPSVSNSLVRTALAL